MKSLNGYRIIFVLVGFVAAVMLAGANANADFIFGTPTNLGPTVNSTSNEQAPSISADGLSLYFSDHAGAPFRPGGLGNEDLWVTTRETKDDPWGIPVNLGPTVNSSATDESPSISADGLSLYFMSTRAGGSGSHDLWVTTRETKDGPWSNPVNLGSTVNSIYSEWCPNISADGLSLYFCDYLTPRPSGYGGWDIYVTTRSTVSDPWGTPVNLGLTVNSSRLDASPNISADGLTLFLNSNRPGALGSDLYVTRRTTTSDPWSTPVNLGPTVNRSGFDAWPNISADGYTLYFASERSGGSGNVDLWQVPILPIVDLNGDMIVDVKDVVIMIEHWGENYSLCDIGPTPLGDGTVDVQDLIVLAEHLFEEILPYGCVAYWKLDEAEGNIAHNSAGDNDGICHGEPIWQPAGGKVDGALLLDGIDDYVETNFVLNPADGAFSAFAWIQGGAPGQVILSQADTVEGRTINPGSTWLGVDPSDGKLMTKLTDSPTTLLSELIITDDEWHHVGIVLIETGSLLYRLMYLDGTMVAIDTQAVELLSSNGGLRIGASNNIEAGTFFSGLIDDVRIYDVALTAEEIAALAQ